MATDDRTGTDTAAPGATTTGGTTPDGPAAGHRHDDTYWRATTGSLDLPPVVGSLDVDVVVVGGGIVGLSTAALAVEAGLQVAVLEAREVGSGTTGGTTGKLTSQNGTRLSQLRSQHGAGAAATYARLTQRGIELFDELTDRHDIACDREVAPAHLVALTAAKDRQIAAEATASREAGLQVLTDEILPELPFPVSSSMTIPDQRQLHAVKLVQGLAGVVAAAGGTVHEGSRVVDVEPDPRDGRRWRVTTTEGEVHADHVVLATRLATHRDTRITFGRSKPMSSVGIAARTTDPAPRGMYLLKGRRDWSIRGSRTEAAGEHLIAVGVGEPTGSTRALEVRTDTLAGWTRERFPVTDVEHRWMAQDQQPADGRPYVGPLWGEGIWTATGFGKWGLAAGTAAAELLVQLITGRPDPYEGAFSTSRVEPPAGWRSILRANLRVGALFAGDRVASLRGDVDDLAPGEGRVVRRGRVPVAVSRDAAGELVAVRATCTHLGCLVRWNREERTWDCGCHGSRFAPDGEVLEAPATAALRAVDLDD